MKTDYFLGLSEEGFHRVAYTEWGVPTLGNPPIICVHGLTRSGRDFDELAEYLSRQGRHVFCPDIVGRGESDWLRNPLHYTYEQYIADMNVMIARTHASQVDWIGTSMGGLIGMVLASMPQSPIRRLVLNDVGAQISATGISRIAKYAGRDPDFSSIEEAMRYFKSVLDGVGKLSDEEWRRVAERSVREISPGKFVSKTDHGVKIAPAKSKMAWQIMLHPLKAIEGTLFDIDLWHIWRKVTCPVLILHGKQSDILLPATIQKMQQIHPQTDVIEVPEAGHAPALMHTAQHQAIYQWLINSI
ncbi:alpha/beta fold hydrolase [Aquicella lusitana]|uniref:Pimeloyl-ACP methyl ester carboxylesterase n=1 Tax=Aquicella lusitana TaxID=254246 RepID=A0A370GMD4_9COXI|nr:alpha/beta hydrolase [Aquicella lusitana]RDI44817.1 pimeloyl-ACP methyl ester carboxylesterase [Aquicella lusitana]VVC73014.1 Tropinesterase [Aquicella lusitana]